MTRIPELTAALLERSAELGADYSDYGPMPKERMDAIVASHPFELHPSYLEFLSVWKFRPSPSVKGSFHGASLAHCPAAIFTDFAPSYAGWPGGDGQSEYLESKGLMPVGMKCVVFAQRDDFVLLINPTDSSIWYWICYADPILQVAPTLEQYLEGELAVAMSDDVVFDNELKTFRWRDQEPWQQIMQEREPVRDYSKIAEFLAENPWQ